MYSELIILEYQKKITGQKIPWKKIQGVTEMERQYQEGLLVAAEFKGLENTSKIWGYLGANCRRGQGLTWAVASMVKKIINLYS